MENLEENDVLMGGRESIQNTAIVMMNFLEACEDNEVREKVRDTFNCQARISQHGQAFATTHSERKQPPYTSILYRYRHTSSLIKMASRQRR